MMTGAMMSVLARCSIASAKAMAPDGPAEFNKSSFSQYGSVTKIVININNITGKPISFIPVIVAI